jgi:hypothetical protein
MTDPDMCLGCGEQLPLDTALCSLSHTIDPGGRLCSPCGRRETLDPAWAEGRRVGLLRGKAAEKAKEQADG